MEATQQNASPLFVFTFSYTPEMILDATRLANRERLKTYRRICWVFIGLSILLTVCALFSDYNEWSYGGVL